MGRGILVARIVLHVRGDVRPDYHCRKEANPLHSLPHAGHKLHCQLIGDLIQAERVQRALAGAWRIVIREERQPDSHSVTVPSAPIAGWFLVAYRQP